MKEHAEKCGIVASIVDIKDCEPEDVLTEEVSYNGWNEWMNEWMNEEKKA